MQEPTIEHFNKLCRLCDKLDENQLRELGDRANEYYMRCKKYLSDEDKEKLNKIWKGLYPNDPYPLSNIVYGAFDWDSLQNQDYIIGIGVGFVVILSIAAWFGYRSFLSSRPLQRTESPSDEKEVKMFANLPDQLRKIYDAYDIPFKPPNWIFSIDLIPYMNSARVYYESDLQSAKTLAFQREPTNIGAVSRYKADILNANFNYSKGAYVEGSQNIAIYTHTPVRTREGLNLNKSINIINAIAPALDSRAQADYKELNNIPNFIKRKILYKTKLKRAFNKIDACFNKNNFSTLVMVPIGQGAFASLASELEINSEEIFIELFIEFWGDDARVLLNDHDNTYIEKIKVNEKQLPKSRYTGHNLSTHVWLESYTQQQLTTILFVNAWDHLSMLGNGNAGDKSVDGFFGAISAISVIGWPGTNTMLNEDSAYILVPNNYKQINKKFPTRDNLEQFISKIPGDYIIIIDPAGAAFQNNNNFNNSAGLSAAIYSAFDLKGIHNLGTLSTGELKFNPNVWHIKNKVVRILHVVGPRGGVNGMTQEIFFKKLNDLLSNIMATINKDGENTVVIPYISGGIFLGNIDQNLHKKTFDAYLLHYCTIYPSINIIHNTM
jgi:hypothetical protein